MTTLHTEVLKPCPFCGGAAMLENHPAHTHGGMASFMPDYPGSATITCANDSCNAGMIASSEEEVIKAWNTRTPQPDAAAIRDQPIASMSDWQDKYLPQAAAQERMERDPATEIASRTLEAFHVGTPSPMPMDAAMSMLEQGLKPARDAVSKSPVMRGDYEGQWTGGFGNMPEKKESRALSTTLVEPAIPNPSDDFDVDLALKLNRIAHDAGNDVRHDVGMLLAQAVKQHQTPSDAIRSETQDAPLAINGKPVAWVRFCSDGRYEGPIMDCDKRMDDSRRTSGVWTPLFDNRSNWLPIESAPEGILSLMYGSRMKRFLIDDWSAYKKYNYPRLTHWMLLPAPPTLARNE